LRKFYKSIDYHQSGETIRNQKKLYKWKTEENRRGYNRYGNIANREAN